MSGSRLPMRLANRISDLLFCPGTARLWARRLRGTVLSLLYHRVDRPGDATFLDSAGLPRIAPEELAGDLAFWKRLGARFATFRDLREGWFPADREIGIVVCFDDGFRDNYTHGLDTLSRLGVPATLFQTASMVGARQLIWEHALYLHFFSERGVEARRLASEALGRPPGTGSRELLDELRGELSLEKVEALVERLFRELGGSEHSLVAARQLYPAAADLSRWIAAGNELGSHGDSHHPRSRLEDAAFLAELAGSQARLAELAGVRPECYSFPFGSFRPGDGALCRRWYRQAAIVRPVPIRRDTPVDALPRASWPGPARNALRRRRWLLSGHI